MAGKHEQTALLDRLYTLRRERLTPADQPLVLIAPGLARSGGTLLLQLLDSHPELHVRPHELKLGDDGAHWPALDLAAGCDALFAQVRDRQVNRTFQEGSYDKDRPAQKLGYGTESFPMLLPPLLLERLFAATLEENHPQRPRDVLAAYFTAYFNAWLDNQNLYGAEKRWVVAFRAKLGRAPNPDAFFADYPDGRHIALVREPKGWIASRIQLRGRDTIDVQEDIGAWLNTVREMLSLRERRGELTRLISFETLLEDAETVMRGLADWLEIEFDPILLSPTFNRMPIKANSSFPVDRHGIVAETTDHWRTVLSADEARRVDARTAELFERARQTATSVP